MRKIYTFFVTLVSLWLPLLSQAADSASDCKATNYLELVRCAERQSSDIQISEQQLKSAQKLEGVANQWINPELDADTVSKGSERSETNASLLFTLRLGGKRDALINEAQSEIERARAGRDLGVYQARLELMLSLYRLSHLKSEIHIEEESVETFSKIVKQFQKRPALSPEQDVSLSVFKMSLADHQLRLTKLKADEEKLFQALTAITGLSKSLLSKNLPPAKQVWPSVESSSPSEDSPQVRAALADLKLARSQKQKAEGDSWPDLKLGPSMKTVKENGESTTFVGLGLSMPLPVFSQNGAGRAYSAQRLLEAEMGAELTKRKSAATRAELVNRYNQTIQSLKTSLSLNIVNEKHEQLERQFFKGLVPSSLVIEAHRQLFDLGERRNASELEALEALGRILILDNKFNEVIL
ncbi:MAG: TolC family protein [Bdellovibrionales bacterium]